MACTEKMHPCIFLVGFHGSGKTTIGRQLQREHGYIHVSLGDLGRLARSMKFPSEHSLRFLVALAGQAAGQRLEPNVVQALRKEIERLRHVGPVSVDGFPAEAEHIALLPMGGAIVHITVPDSERETRLLHRASVTKRLWTPGQRSLRDEAIPSIIDAALECQYPLWHIENTSGVERSVASIANLAKSTFL
ncbi:AAA family ATPase [Hydrogenophaga sp. NFH-34]|uniref:AAA family ATPase n=1 Tax=Hydrogenophaga sp. NFH-34 TaxID=2744446 RepID=UPI001F4740C4|nr:AAA family ATPase [Hydrogenophaga sp. NFH-34]